MNKLLVAVLLILSYYIGLISGIIFMDNNSKTTIVTKNTMSEEQKIEINNAIDLYEFGFEYEEHFI